MKCTYLEERGEKGDLLQGKNQAHLAHDFSAAYLTEIRNNVDLMYMVMTPKSSNLSSSYQNIQTTTTKKCSHQSNTNIGTLTSSQRSKWAPLSHLLKCICPLTTEQVARFTLVNTSQKKQGKVAGKTPHFQPQVFCRSWETRGATPLFPRCRSFSPLCFCDLPFTVAIFYQALLAKLHSQICSWGPHTLWNQDCFSQKQIVLLYFSSTDVHL